MRSKSIGETVARVPGNLIHLFQRRKRQIVPPLPSKKAASEQVLDPEVRELPRSLFNCGDSISEYLDDQDSLTQLERRRSELAILVDLEHL